MKNTLFLLACTALLLFNCSKDDGDSENGNTSVDLSVISGVEGTKMETNNSSGNKVSYSGNLVIGWDTAQLLNTNYAKILRLSLPDFGTLYIRFSIPSGSEFLDVAVKEHALYGTTVLLQDTEDLEDTIVEMYTVENNTAQQFTGKLELKRAVDHLGSVIDMVGTFEIERNGQSYTGLFWKTEVAGW